MRMTFKFTVVKHNSFSIPKTIQCYFYFEGYPRKTQSCHVPNTRPTPEFRAAEKRQNNCGGGDLLSEVFLNSAERFVRVEVAE